MKEEIRCDKAPKAIGPYSQAIRFGNLVFISGQIPVDPSTGNMVSGDIKKMTETVLTNIKNILNSIGLDMKDILKTTIYLKDMENFKDMNDVYSLFFKPPYPARVTVAVKELPKYADIEIEAIAGYGD